MDQELRTLASLVPAVWMEKWLLTALPKTSSCCWSALR